MEEEVLSALLDLRIAIGELQAALCDIEQSCRKLTAVQIDALAAKNMPLPLCMPETQKEDSHE